MIDHLYYTFYNKISGTSLSQWIPTHLHRCWWLIFNAISDGGILETEHINGEVVQETIIHHNYIERVSVHLGFWMTLLCQLLDLAI